MSTGEPLTNTERCTDDGILIGLVRVRVHDADVSIVMVPLEPAAATKADVEHVVRVTVVAPAEDTTPIRAVTTAPAVVITGSKRFQLRR